MQQHPHILRSLVLSRVIFFLELWVRVPFRFFFIDSCRFSLILTQFSHRFNRYTTKHSIPNYQNQKKIDYVDILDFRPDRLEPMVTHRTTLLRRLIGHLGRVLELPSFQKIHTWKKKLFQENIIFAFSIHYIMVNCKFKRNYFYWNYIG